MDSEIIHSSDDIGRYATYLYGMSITYNGSDEQEQDEHNAWDAPETPALTLEEAAERFLNAARELQKHVSEERYRGSMSRFTNRMTIASLDYGYQMITGRHLPHELRFVYGDTED